MATEVYNPVRSIEILGHTYENIQGIPAVPIGAPFRAGHIPEFSLVSVNGHMGENERILRNRLVKISPIHGRSYEMRFGEARHIFWQDEYGNLFSTITTKGNNLEEPKVLKQEVSPSGYMIYGMQDSDAMVRMLKASQLLRANHIGTEMILRVMEPQELPFGDQVVPLAEFKKLLIKQVWEQNADKDSTDDQGDGNLTREDIPSLTVALDKMTLFLTIRGLQVSERLADLAQASDPDEIKKILSPAFLYANMSEKQNARRDPSYIPDSFDINKEEDRVRYLTQYLPIQIARNFATLHKLGLVHVFPHTGNISLVGSFYDLDSVQGEPLGLGDDKVTIEDIKHDLHGFLVDQSDTFPNPAFIVNMVDGIEGKNFSANFLKEYFKQMGWEGDILRFADISELIQACDLNETEINAAEYFQKIELPPNFINRPLIGEFADFFSQHMQAIVDEFGLTNNDINRVVKYVDGDIMGIHFANLFVQSENISSEEDKERVLLYFSLYTKLLLNRYGLQRFLTIPLDSASPSVDLTDLEVPHNHLNALYEKMARSWGWEDDIATHIEEIDKLFDQFTNLEDRAQCKFYCDKLREQLDLSFTISKPIEEMIVDFNKHDHEVMVSTIDIGMGNVAESEDPQQAVIKILNGENEQKTNYTHL